MRVLVVEDEPGLVEALLKSLRGLFQSGTAAIAAPFPESGTDPTTDSLGCDQ